MFRKHSYIVAHISKQLVGNKVYHNSTNSSHFGGLIENVKTLVALLLKQFLAIIQGLQLHNLTNRIWIDSFNKGSQQGSEWYTLILTAHWWALFVVSQGLNNSDIPLALAGNVGFEAVKDETFVCVCFCRKPLLNHLHWFFLLISSGV